MNSNKFSRVIALLLSLVMLLGTLPTSAIAEVGPIVSNAQYDTLLEQAIAQFYAAALKCERHEDLADLINSLSFEQYEAVRATFTADEIAALDAHDWELLLEMIRLVPRNVTRPAKLLMPPVYYSGNSETRMAAYATNNASGARATEGLVLSKTAEKVESGYEIQLEAYTTGTVTSVTKAQPADIVLVLDQSGSMAYQIGKNPVYNLDTSKTYYVISSSGSSSVTTVRYYNDYGWYGGNRRYTPKTSADDTTNGRVQFYESYETRREAITNAVNSFLTDVRTNNALITEGVGHRVGIIGFSGNGNQEVIRQLGTNLNNIGNNELTANGGTYIEDGLNEAITMLRNSNTADVAGQTRNRVVIVFTDGDPGTGDWDSASSMKCAVDAVTYANTLKKATDNGGMGATVYSIGIFEGANPGDTSGESNRFMNAVSSNYPNATARYSSWGGASYSITLGTKSTAGNYYLSASDSDALNNIFKNLSGVVGTQNVELSSSAVIKDIIAPSFVLPEGAVVTLMTSDRTATGGWTTPVNAPASVSYSVSKQNGEQMVSVTGFDYNKNYVADVGRDETNPKEPGDFYGRKLIVKFTIEVKEGFLGGNEVPTNGANSGMYKDTNAETALGYFDVPVINEEVQRIQPSINDDHIYLSNLADLKRLMGLYDKTALYEYRIVDADGKPIEDKTYGIDGVLNAHVKISYLFEDEDGNDIATFTIEPGATTGTLTYISGTAPLLNKDTTYTVTCTVTPKVTEPTKDEYKDRTYYGATDMDAEGTVFVYKPVLTFQDTDEAYKSEIDHTNDSYYQANNYVSSSTYWENDSGKKSTEVSMSGDMPEITLDYTASEALLVNRVVESKNDVKVNVTVSLNGDKAGDYTAHSSSIRKDCDCGEHSCDHTDETPAASMGNDPEFIVHVYDVYGHLAITKTVEAPNGVTPAYSEFTFAIELAVPDGDYTYKLSGDETIHTLKITNGKGTIKLTDGQTATIMDLPPETAYKVTETVPTGYSESLSEDSAALEGKIIAGTTVKVGVTNTYAVGSLTISKTVDGTYAPNEVFTFTVNLTAKDGSALAGSYSYSGAKSGTIENGGTITLTDGQSVTITGIPAGAEYAVIETENDDYVTTKTGDTGTIAANETKTAEFTNVYQYQMLTINKELIDPTFAQDDSKTFTFKIAPAPDASEWQKTKFNEKVQDSQQITIKGTDSDKMDSVSVIVPVGSYVVTENEYLGFTTEYWLGNAPSAAAPTITVSQGSDAAVTVKNTRILQNVTVNKVWEDENDFHGLRGKVVVTLNGDAEQTLTEDTGWTYTWRNVPVYDLEDQPISYTVTEEPIEHYEMTYAVNGGTASTKAPAFNLTAGDATVDITNKLPLGELTISKSGLETGEHAQFTVSGPNGESFTVVLGGDAGTSATITNLRLGTYTVTETEWSWTYKETDSQDAEVSEETPGVVTFENTKNDKWLYDEGGELNEFSVVSPSQSN